MNVNRDFGKETANSQCANDKRVSENIFFLTLYLQSK